MGQQAIAGDRRQAKGISGGSRLDEVTFKKRKERKKVCEYPSRKLLPKRVDILSRRVPSIQTIEFDSLKIIQRIDEPPNIDQITL